jgi:glutathione synthase/RimK-type ligase-like ATP-grasp enzyme
MEDYINFGLRNQYDKKVIFIRNNADPRNLAGDADEREAAINAACAEQLYITYYADKDVKRDDIIIPRNMPILYYGGNVPAALKFLEKFNINPKNLYNIPSQMKISGDKVAFSKKFADNDWLPKTVFKKEDAINGAVGFPVIAKISDGHSGLGISKFDTADDLKKDKETFELRGEQRSYDLFSQFIDFDREYRCLFIKDRCFVVNERVTIEDNEKSIRNKKVDEKVKFIYAYQDLDKIPDEFMCEIHRIANEVREHIKLELWSLDIIVDKEGKIWVLETNSATGLGSVKLCEVYAEIYADFYGRELPDFYKEELWRKYRSQGHGIYWPEYKDEILSSAWPMEYEEILSKYPRLEF